MVERGEIVWRPSARQAAGTRLAEFAQNQTYEQLHKWSVESPEKFWAKVWQFCGVVGDRGETVIARPASTGDPVLAFVGTRFFPEAKLSVVENFLQRTGTDEALVAIAEDGRRESRSWDELKARVASLATALADRGVGEGDRVAQSFRRVRPTSGPREFSTGSAKSRPKSCSPPTHICMAESSLIASSASSRFETVCQALWRQSSSHPRTSLHLANS